MSMIVNWVTAYSVTIDENNTWGYASMQEKNGPYTIYSFEKWYILYIFILISIMQY